MDRTISVRSSLLDKTEKVLRALGNEKEAELKRMGIISHGLFSSILIVPSIEEGKLGYFEPSSRLIAISEHVVSEGSGRDVRDIFLHELAHALDYAANGSLSGHSPRFREYCSLLGVTPGFEKSKVKLAIAKQDEKRERIEKLLRLSSSPFENEAAEAIKKAKALMAKEGITLSEEREEKIYIVPLYKAKRFPFSIRMLLSYISNTTGVYIVISEKPDGKEAIAYGTLEETEASIYLYDYIISASEREIAKLRTRGERISKDSFIRGALNVLSSRTADSASDTAIVAIRDENIRLAKKLIFPEVRLHRTTTRSHGWDEKSFSKGQGFGSKLKVPEGVGRRSIEG